MKVLFCTDGSKISYDAIENFSKWTTSETTVDAICIIDWSFLPEEVIIEETGFVNSCRNVADSILEHAEKVITNLDLTAGKKIKLCGAAVESILDQAEKEEYDLIILGSHGKKGIQRWLGSVSREVLDAADLPVYISKNKNLSNKILFTTDGSETSYTVTEQAIKTLNLSGKEVYLCTVTENPDLLFLEGTLDSNWMMAIRTQQEIYSEHAVKKILELFERYNIEVKQSRILEGTPAKSIIGYAEEISADLIVLGSGRKTKMQNFLLDSVSKRVVEHTKSDTIVFRSR